MDKLTVDPVLTLFRYLEYKRQNLFIVEFDAVDAITVFSADRPRLSLGETYKVKYPNIYEKMQSGGGEWLPLSFVLNDTIAPSAAEKLYNWVTKQWDYLSARAGYKSDYAKNLVIKLLDPNGLIVESWVLHNSFLTGEIDWNVNGLNYDSSDRLKVKFTLDYDFAELITGGGPSGL
jgi:hypothetical protein